MTDGVEPSAAPARTLLDEVMVAEAAYVRARRAASARSHDRGAGPADVESAVDAGPKPASDPGSDLEPLDGTLIGLSLSGGGIRSATTCLGVLQALAELRLLPVVDYLSTVSGGGYIGSALSALLSLEEGASRRREEAILRGEDGADVTGSAVCRFGPGDRPRFDTSAERFPLLPQQPDAADAQQAEVGRLSGTTLVKHLRMHGGYLMTRGGLARVSTLRALGSVWNGVSTHLATFALALAWIAALLLLVAFTLAPLDGLGSQAAETSTLRAALAALPGAFAGALSGGHWLALVLAFVAGASSPLAAVHVRAEGPGRLAARVLRRTGMWSHHHRGEAAEDAAERNALRQGLVGTAVLGLLALLLCGLWLGRSLVLLAVPLAVALGAQLACLYVYWRLPTRAAPPYWTRENRAHWAAYQAMALYGVVGTGLLLAVPLVAVAAAGAGGVSALVAAVGALASRLLARLQQRGGESRLPQALLRLLLTLAVFTVILFGVLAFATLWLQLGAGWTLAGAVALTALLAWLGRTVNINKLSLHYFYRDRLSEAYLAAEVDQDGRMYRVHDASELPLWRLHGTPAGAVQDVPEAGEVANSAPYHLLVCALNLSGSRDLTRKDRKSGHFIFSKLYCGSAQTGYRPTARYRRGGTKLARAMTISGAAAASAAGYHTFFAQAFAAALFNVRLGYWMRNPGHDDWQDWESGVYWPAYLLKEMFASTTAEDPLVNLSDGGHTGDNLGIYPLLERRCRLIIAVDAEADPQLRFNSLLMLCRHAYIDHGIDIDIDLGRLRRGEQGWSGASAALGTIDYPPAGGRPRERGWLLLLKSTLTGRESEAVRGYATGNDFPHQTTLDQFFDDAQFESYRALGRDLALRELTDPVRRAAEPLAALASGGSAAGRRGELDILLQALARSFEVRTGTG